MSVLVVAENSNTELKSSTFNTITAASNISDEIHVVVIGSDCEGVAKQTSYFEKVKKVWHIDDPRYDNPIAEVIAPIIVKLSENYSHILAPASTFGKNFMPRVSALLDFSQISDVIKRTQFNNLDIITSNVDLSGLEVETADDSNRAFILKSKLTAYLNNSRGSYDYVLIDCPPSLSLLTVMALVSSNSLLVPLQTEFFALEGLTQLMKTIERIKVNLNPGLQIRGILLTMYDKRNKLSSQVEKEARDYFTEKVYSTVIPRNVRLSEAPSHGMPVLIYDKSCPGSKSYFSFTDEFINQESTVGSAA